MKKEKCFICLSPLLGTAEVITPVHRRSVEHAIPLWLLKESQHHLSGKAQRYTLINGQQIKGHLTVPCCRRCNDKLGELEGWIKQYFKSNRSFEDHEADILFIWLLKIAFATTYREYQGRISPRDDVNFGSLISNKAFNRMRRFHGRLLREFCVNNRVPSQFGVKYSLLQAHIEQKDFILSKSIIRQRIVVAWNGIALRLSLDDGAEANEMRQKNVDQIESDDLKSVLSSEDLVSMREIGYGEIRRGKYKFARSNVRKLKPGDEVLVFNVNRAEKEMVIITGYILHKGRISGEEEFVRVIVRRQPINSRLTENIVEIWQPTLGVALEERMVVGDFAEELGFRDQGITAQQEDQMTLGVIGEKLGIKFYFNSNLGFTLFSVP